MKKALLLAVFTILFFGAIAQDAERTIPGSGVSCFRTDIGGCFSYAIGTFCSEYIYHVEICCARPSFGTGYQVCHSSTWTTINPNYRLHTGAVPATGNSVTLEELVKRFAGSNGLKPDDVVSFIVTDSDPFQGEDGLWYQVEKGTYKIDRSVPGWSLVGFNTILYKKE